MGLYNTWLLCTDDNKLSNKSIELSNKTYYILGQEDDFSSIYTDEKETEQFIQDSKSKYMPEELTSVYRKAYILLTKYNIDKVYVIESCFSSLDMKVNVRLDRILTLKNK